MEDLVMGGEGMGFGVGWEAVNRSCFVSSRIS